MQKSADYWIEKFNLKPHPEGGYYKETYRSGEFISRDALPDRYSGSRNMSTCVYFLIEDGGPSNMHRLISDEVWHFYAGSPMTLFIIDEKGRLTKTRLGNNPDNDENFQTVVPKNAWFGGSVDQPGGYSLVGCTIAPGFDFDDFELAEKETLMKAYPEHKKIIDELS